MQIIGTALVCKLENSQQQRKVSSGTWPWLGAALKRNKCNCGWVTNEPGPRAPSPTDRCIYIYRGQLKLAQKVPHKTAYSRKTSLAWAQSLPLHLYPYLSLSQREKGFDFSSPPKALPTNQPNTPTKSTYILQPTHPTPLL